MVLDLIVPCLNRKSRKGRPSNCAPLSLCRLEGDPNMLKSSNKCFFTVSVFISLQGNANGYLEYSSTKTSMNLFSEMLGMGPMKSIESLSHGLVARIRVLVGGLKKFGLSNLQVLQFIIISLISPIEYGRFLALQ